jgi:hypothetical protein
MEGKSIPPGKLTTHRMQFEKFDGSFNKAYFWQR